MQKNEQLTNKWIKANGLSVESFNEIEIELLKAQKIAHTLLKEHGGLLRNNESAMLNDFIKSMNNKKLRSKITQKQCYAVMNIGTAVNRKLFKAYKALQR